MPTRSNDPEIPKRRDLALRREPLAGDDDGSAPPTPSAPVSEVTVVDAWAGVRVRQTPGPGGWTLGALKTGAKVQIVEGPMRVDPLNPSVSPLTNAPA